LLIAAFKSDLETSFDAGYFYSHWACSIDDEEVLKGDLGMDEHLAVQVLDSTEDLSHQVSGCPLTHLDGLFCLVESHVERAGVVLDNGD
jgi:hypothetical protein